MVEQKEFEHPCIAAAPTRSPRFLPPERPQKLLDPLVQPPPVAVPFDGDLDQAVD